MQLRKGFSLLEVGVSILILSNNPTPKVAVAFKTLCIPISLILTSLIIFFLFGKLTYISNFIPILIFFTFFREIRNEIKKIIELTTSMKELDNNLNLVKTYTNLTYWH